MTTRFFTWLRRWHNLPLFRSEWPLRRKPLESIRKAKQFLDFERLEERNPVAEAIGPFLTTTAMSISGQLLAVLAPPRMESSLPRPEVRSQPTLPQNAQPSSPPVELSGDPVGPNHVSAGVPETSQETVPAASNAASGFEGKPLFATLGQDPLTTDPASGSKPTGTSGGTADSPGGGVSGNTAIGGGAGYGGRHEEP